MMLLPCGLRGDTPPKARSPSALPPTLLPPCGLLLRLLLLLLLLLPPAAVNEILRARFGVEPPLVAGDMGGVVPPGSRAIPRYQTTTTRRGAAAKPGSEKEERVLSAVSRSVLVAMCMNKKTMFPKVKFSRYE